jgi:type IV secretion system protein VirB10
MILLLGCFAYSAWRRQGQDAIAASGKLNKKVEAARPDDFQQGLTLDPSGNRDRRPPSLNPADQSAASPSGLPSERVVVRTTPAPRPIPPVAPPPPVREVTPEERALAAAYTSEQQARMAPTGIRSGRSAETGSQRFGLPVSNESGPSAIESIARTLANAGSRTGAAPPSGLSTRSEYEEQNLQGQKEGFLEKARLGNVQEDYLKFTRTPPMSRFEIKAGWEIPAALEQALNSDLPGEIKSLVMSNVYDTATGLYLLIPQGSRLVGTYNSRIGYGQNGVQVAWRRIIFPDGSAIDLNGMEGLDAQGNAGLRDKVDRHHKQLFGFAVLTSMFDAALAITQSRQQSVLAYPSATQEAESAAGREVSQLGTQITRKNLNVQPTVKIAAGYKFNVRVNRDILFEEPYH